MPPLPAFYPPRGGPYNNRSICQYLQEENERDGMCAYMDWSLQHYYSGILPYYFSEQEKQQESTSVSKSMFVCYEDWTNPSKRDQLYEQSLQFLFPGGGSSGVRWKNVGDGDTQQQQQQHQQVEERGGHATDHDPELRRRLRDLVKKLDFEVFEGTVSKSNAVFGCSDR
jgi:hypothetical protein